MRHEAKLGLSGSACSSTALPNIYFDKLSFCLYICRVRQVREPETPQPAPHMCGRCLESCWASELEFIVPKNALT
jgi:hypothetical protein